MPIIMRTPIPPRFPRVIVGLKVTRDWKTKSSFGTMDSSLLGCPSISFATPVIRALLVARLNNAILVSAQYRRVRLLMGHCSYLTLCRPPDRRLHAHQENGTADAQTGD